MRLLLFFALVLVAGPPAQALELSAAQRQWIAAHRIVRVAPDVDLAPIDMVDAGGRHVGLGADYLKLIGARSGLEFRVQRTASRADALKALREHRLDLVPAVASADDPAVALSTPYLRLSGAIYVRNGEPGFASLEQLSGHAVGVVETQAWLRLLGDQKGGSYKIEKFRDMAAALQALRDKSIDAYVGDPFTTADALARLKQEKNIVLSGQLGIVAPLSFAMRGDWPELREIVDAALQSVSVEDEKALRERWLKGTSTPAAASASTLPSLPPSHASAIDEARRAATRSHEVGSDVRKAVDDLLQQASEDEAAADQLVAQWQSLNQTAAGADAEAQKIEDALATSDTNALLEWRASLPERASVDQLETLLAHERDDLGAAKSAAAALQTELDRQTLRPTQLRAEITAAQATLDGSREAAPGGSSNALTQAHSLRNQAAARRATVQIALLNLENRSYESRMRLLSAQLRDRQRLAGETAQHVAALEALVLDRTGAVVAELRARVTRERDQAIAQFRLLADPANANLALVDQLAGTVNGLSELRTQNKDWTDWQRETAQALKNTEERIRVGGISEAVGLILLAEKARLKPLPLLKRALARLQTDLARTRIGLIELREQQDNLADLGGAVTQALARLPEPSRERLNDLRTGMFRLLSTRADILPVLIQQQTRLAAADGDAEQTLRELVAATERLGAMLDARLLWTPSQKPIDADWLARLPGDASTFFAPRRWSRVASNAVHSIMTFPLLVLAALGVIGTLLVARRRIAGKLEQLAAPMRRIRTDRYRLTGNAMAWTILAALPAPLMLWLLGYVCRQVPSGSGNLTEETGYAIGTLVMPTAGLALLRSLCAENGVAQFHFRWPRPRRESLRAAVPWIALCVLPAQFVLSLLLLRGDAAQIDTVGRTVLALSVVGCAAVSWHLFAPGRVWTSRDTKLVEPLRLRQIARVIATGGNLLLAVWVLRGYFVTVAALAGNLVLSLGVLLVVAIAQGLAVRWLVLGERRLALKRMQEKRDSDQEQRERAEGESESETLPEPEPEEITLASVSLQTRRLLRALTVFGLISALLWIWSGVTPAVTMLDEIPVWKDQHVSLLGVIEALVVLTLTWIATRNLPGLLEVGLLRRIHIDAPTRYAVTSVTRYVIIFAGTIVGLSLLGLRWNNLQWLAAGFSVGLGFGMQEIFANFISGLMVLFERPFRVGDIITIGTVEGTVSRIRTRATTIVDWDNREVIVPNKSFITDRLVNWTLSDSTTRIVIKVGIAYRNDPRQAQRLLLEIALAHPQVLAEPAPSCWMTGFGDNTQDFELRVYVAEIGQRNPVRTDLQMRISELFRENDIEIAFPQMDLWLRNPVQLERPAKRPRAAADRAEAKPPSSGEAER